MDMAIVISVMILAFITVLELVFILRGGKCRENMLDYVAVIPVFPSDKDLAERLGCLSEKIACGRCQAEEIILIDYNALPEQLEICRGFCRENNCAVIAGSDDFEKILSQIFAIETEI
ncbi:MAG: hypothetical protein K2J08_07745 [Ruminococcus sp.]|nr:hypothetical protein [Ruminococcus sp.]